MKASERLLNVGLVLASLLLCAAAGEVLLRVVGYEYRAVQIVDRTGRDDRGNYIFGNDDFMPDEDLIWRPRPGVSVFNEQGFRGEIATVPRPAGTVRIFTVGDSNTLGWAGFGPNWPDHLAAELHGRGMPAQVINAGVWGYTSFQGLTRTREVMTYEPDIVLVSFGSNDAHHVTTPDAEFVNGYRSSALGRTIGSFKIGQGGMFLVDVARSFTGTTMRPRVALADYRANLRSIVETVRAGGADAVLLTRPFFGTNHDPLWWKNFGPDYNRATVEVAAEMSAPAVDIYTYFKDSEEFFVDESHFEDSGHRITAEIIARRILPLVGKHWARNGGVPASLASR